METRRVFLARHGKIRLEDDQRRYIGQLDLPLSGEGVRQAEVMRKMLGQVVTAVYCSDLARSRQTAEIIAGDGGVAVTPRSELREISLGEWEGCTFADITRRFPNEFRARGADIAYYRVPGGESFADCSLRAVAAFHDILGTSAGDIAIVGHAGVNRLLLCNILGLPLGNLFRIGQDYGCINIIKCSEAGYQVQLVNFR
ncbi:MAG TPA: histidine phosphatase family protein [Negativicutes bacterium]|nr:histidine phosphatase family protein [Negativicutes bacterium]